MFRRKQPPQLSLYEELQQTYNDVCNITVKNLTLEEEEKFEDALKGWKSLHTSLLFKTDLFEKQQSKLSNDELKLLQDIKSIRDENVKHLIRVQLRIDEKLRRQKKVTTTTSNTTNHLSNLSVPSLRTSKSFNNSNNSNNRSMLKSLRPNAENNQSNHGSLSNISIASKKAAVLSWQKPKNANNSRNNSINIQKVKSNDDDKLFDDFDQDSFEFNNSNWDRVNSFTSNDSNDQPPPLIDLDESPPPPIPKHDYFSPISHSLEDLSINDKKPPVPAAPAPVPVPPPPPPPRLRSTNVDKLKPAPRNALSKSTPDVSRQHQSPSPPKKKYIYTKPKPININQLMKVNQQPSTKKPIKKPQMTKPTTKTKLNISYNYKVIGKPSEVKPHSQVNKRILSPTTGVPTTTKPIDDISDDEDEEEEVEEVEEVEDEGKAPISEEAQDALIKSIRGIDYNAAKQILNDIVVHGDEVYWEDIVGLEAAKNLLKEAVVYPFLRPDLFKGLREPTRGMLLFGPPGTGKTMLARAVATESKSTFFSISSSSLTSKYLGESEKLVKALFLLAKELSPSIVFIDEIDSLLSSRTEGEVESSRRIKNEFLVQWSELSSAAAGRGNTNNKLSQVLILGATNLPWSIDEAARRRFVKRQYIPLPELETRKAQIIKLLKYQKHTLLEQDFEQLISLTEGFSGSDITALAKDSAMGPLRSLGDLLLSTPTEKIRSIQLEDFKLSLKYIRPSVSSDGLKEYEEWANKFGSSGV